MAETPKRTFVVTLEVSPRPTPIGNLRRWLKHALRACGCRVVRIREDKRKKA